MLAGLGAAAARRSGPRGGGFVESGGQAGTPVEASSSRAGRRRVAQVAVLLADRGGPASLEVHALSASALALDGVAAHTARGCSLMAGSTAAEGAVLVVQSL